jgi:hypothetical protein
MMPLAIGLIAIGSLLVLAGLIAVGLHRNRLHSFAQM